MPNKKIVDRAGRELYPGLVVRWLLNGVPFEGSVRVVRANGELLCMGGRWRTWDGALGFTCDWVDRLVSVEQVMVVGWNDPGHQYSWYKPVEDMVEQEREPKA